MLPDSKFDFAQNEFSLNDIKKLSRFIDNVPVGLFVLYVSKKFTSLNDLDAFIVYANNSYYAIHKETPPAEFPVKKSFLEKIHPEDINSIYTKYVQESKTFENTGFNHLYRYLCGDNQYHWVKTRARLIHENDEYYIFYGSVNNYDLAVEETKQLQNRFSAEVEKLTSFDKDKFFFCSCNISKNTTIDFKSFSETDYPQLISKSFEETRNYLLSLITNKEDFKKLSELTSENNLIARFLQGDLHFSYQFQQLINKRLIWTELSISLLKEPQTKDILCFATLTNINEKKQTKSVLQRLVSIDYENVFLINTQDESCSFISNSTEKEIVQNLSELKYTHGIEMYLRRNYVGSDLSKFLETISLNSVQKALDTYPIYVTTFAEKAAELVRTKKMLFTYTDDSKQYLCVVLQDITNVIQEQKKQQKLLQDAVKKAEKANSIKRDFLAHISYDVRTPLNAISGIINLAKDAKNNPEEISYYLNQIDTSCQIMTGLFNDVIDMSQIENGFFELHPESYSYSDFLNFILKPIQAQCKEKEISFIYNDKETFPPIMVDKQRFNQIFYNLFSNALKYTQAKEKITFSIDNKKVENNLFIADFIVSDTGAAYEEEHLKQIEQLFEKNKISEIYSNTSIGLGLSIVKIFVTLLGGKIAVESKPQTGTKFTISLAIPLAKTTVSKPADDSHYIEDFAMLEGKTVLLVEDNYLNREICFRQLEKKKINVVQAVNGEEAYNIFKESEPGTFNAILMDIQMPVMNGYEATKAIRALNRVDALLIPIIAMSADGFIENIKASLSVGMVAHLTKPINLDKLYGTLAAFCTN